MAIDKGKKMDAEEFYARRAEVQDLVSRGVIQMSAQEADLIMNIPDGI